ncbi:MAG TPA: HEPN domain-containing protein [Ktedonobacterales bacterium]|jgi:HEPN domain-containing protein|nr:HEPN domain-containing protein [Ktedonobacterales bacterium]
MSMDEALSYYAEAAQDLASAGLSNAAGMHYNCADLCNQAAEKTLQALYAAKHDARAPYDHNLRTLGALVGAPEEILADLDTLTPYHPSIFLERVDAELADDEVGGDVASALLVKARAVMRWARPILLA